MSKAKRNKKTVPAAPKGRAGAAANDDTVITALKLTAQALSAEIAAYFHK